MLFGTCLNNALNAAPCFLVIVRKDLRLVS